MDGMMLMKWKHLCKEKEGENSRIIEKHNEKGVIKPYETLNNILAKNNWIKNYNKEIKDKIYNNKIEVIDNLIKSPYSQAAHDNHKTTNILSENLQGSQQSKMNTLNESEYIDYRDIDKSQTGSSRQQSIIPSTDSKRSLFIDLELLAGNIYKTGINELLFLVVGSCEFISITTDLWTTKSRTGYIGITAIAISNYLEKYIKDYQDNGSNMKAAINNLNQKIKKYKGCHEMQNEVNKKNQSLTEISDDEPFESFSTNILKNINKVPTYDQNNKLDSECLQKIMINGFF
ncbi:hypothetical protein C1646_752431 [Rhizophagus diaphanus]|nr:hypothetical protein C1646_752431 [Rhizophagus diaphanus] [Rhizophagus sp. MUCL 43196]